MKKFLLSLVVALSASASFAQSGMSAAQVCQRIAEVSGSNGAVCAQLIARNHFDQGALDLAHQVLSQGSTHAVGVLNATANRRFEVEAGQACSAIASISGSNTVACAKAAVDKRISPDLVRIVRPLAAQGSVHVVGAMQAGADAYLYSPLADVCVAMAGVSGSNTVACVSTIANKVTMNQSEQVCRTALNNGSSYALQCLRGVVLDYAPVPEPTRVMVELYQLQDLRRSLSKARSMLDRGMIENARRSIDDALIQLDYMTVPTRQ